GVPKKEMLSLAEGNRPVLRDVQSLTDWLWYVNTKGSLAEAVAATSFAIEGVAGDIARKVTAGFEAYGNQPGVEMGPKTYKWFREHAHYDDLHPKIALEIIKRYATTEKMQTRVMLAAKRSIQLLHNALVTAYQAYSPAQVSDGTVHAETRTKERRIQQLRLACPDRRFRERRGFSARKVA
ncbi:MAG TPA: iron-containing redox enzyme family protein, partial [Burkholderiales bacterium]|nr:iron-containing redox enzyme family protein [Burkholderiales bacterium]